MFTDEMIFAYLNEISPMYIPIFVSQGFDQARFNFSFLIRLIKIMVESFRLETFHARLTSGNIFA